MKNKSPMTKYGKFPKTVPHLRKYASLVPTSVNPTNVPTTMAKQISAVWRIFANAGMKPRQSASARRYQLMCSCQKGNVEADSIAAGSVAESPGVTDPGPPGASAERRSGTAYSTAHAMTWKYRNGAKSDS